MCSIWMQSQKRQNDVCSFPRQTIQYHSNPSLCPQPIMLKKLKLNEVEWRPFRTNTKKDALFIIGDWNAKVGSQEIPGGRGKFGLGVQNETGKRLTVLSIECIGHNKHPLPTTQEMILHMDITKWTIPISEWLYSLQPKMEKLYTVSKNKMWSWLWLRPSAPYCKIQD